jgi:hypothetical protein
LLRGLLLTPPVRMFRNWKSRPPATSISELKARIGPE